MDKDKLINAIRNATNGSFIADNACMTCLGWIRMYDDEGRDVTSNPNYIRSSVNIDGHTYNVSKHEWNVTIYDSDNNFITEVDTEPQYVKEYWNRKKMEKTQEL